jgi:hypothetical protein
MVGHGSRYTGKLLKKRLTAQQCTRTWLDKEIPKHCQVCPTSPSVVRLSLWVDYKAQQSDVGVLAEVNYCVTTRLASA